MEVQQAQAGVLGTERIASCSKPRLFAQLPPITPAVQPQGQQSTRPRIPAVQTNPSCRKSTKEPAAPFVRWDADIPPWQRQGEPASTHTLHAMLLESVTQV